MERESLFSFQIRPVLAWYDLWLGAYFDRANRTLYVLPLPCVGFKVIFRRAVSILVTDVGSVKIKAIREIRLATRLGLREAKEATEGTGLTLTPEVGYPLAEALRDLGVAVEVRRA